MRYIRLTSRLSFVILTLSLFMSGCASIPPEVSQVHQKELEIIESLRSSHLALVDSYVDMQIEEFDTFFFLKYAPVFAKNWKAAAKRELGREYEDDKDFSNMSQDLVTEYQELLEPVELLRGQLKQSILIEYSNVVEIHKAIDRWMKSIGELQTANRMIIDQILKSIKPGISTESIDKAMNSAIEKLKNRIN